MTGHAFAIRATSCTARRADTPASPVSDRVSVTIGIPFLNARPYLADAVRSVFAQTHHDWELILIDDGSSDGSLDVVRHLDDPRVRVLLHRYGPPLLGTRRTRFLVLRSGLKSMAYRVGTTLGLQDRLIARRNRPLSATEMREARRILSLVRATRVAGLAEPLRDEGAA